MTADIPSENLHEQRRNHCPARYERDKIRAHRPSHGIYRRRRQIGRAHPEAGTKNLFVRDDKKQHFYLITVCEHKRVDLKAFAAENGLRKLSFASEEDLWQYLALRPGSVSPLGLLSGNAGEVRFFLDADLRGSLVGAHPCENTATVYLSDSDLLSLLRGAGIECSYTSIPERD